MLSLYRFAKNKEINGFFDQGENSPCFDEAEGAEGKLYDCELPPTT